MNWCIVNKRCWWILKLDIQVKTENIWKYETSYIITFLNSKLLKTTLYFLHWPSSERYELERWSQTLYNWWTFLYKKLQMTYHPAWHFCGLWWPQVAECAKCTMLSFVTAHSRCQSSNTRTAIITILKLYQITGKYLQRIPVKIHRWCRSPRLYLNYNLCFHVISCDKLLWLDMQPLWIHLA